MLRCIFGRGAGRASGSGCRSVSSTPSSSSWNGSGVERERISSSVACSSISPVAIAGFTVSGARRTTSPARPDDELVAERVRDLGRLGGVLGVDDDLEQALLVAEVDEDEPAVVAAAWRPSRRRVTRRGRRRSARSELPRTSRHVVIG